MVPPVAVVLQQVQEDTWDVDIQGFVAYLSATGEVGRIRLAGVLESVSLSLRHGPSLLPECKTPQ